MDELEEILTSNSAHKEKDVSGILSTSDTPMLGKISPIPGLIGTSSWESGVSPPLLQAVWEKTATKCQLRHTTTIS